MRCYNFDIEGTDSGNSTFLIEMEEKVPHIVYTKWEEEKTKLEAEGEEIDIAKFIMFYTNLVNIEENAQYLRKTTHSNDKGGHSKNKALVLHGDVKSNVPQVKSFDYTPKRVVKQLMQKRASLTEDMLLKLINLQAAGRYMAILKVPSSRQGRARRSRNIVYFVKFRLIILHIVTCLNTRRNTNKISARNTTLVSCVFAQVSIRRKLVQIKENVSFAQGNTTSICTPEKIL